MCARAWPQDAVLALPNLPIVDRGDRDSVPKPIRTGELAGLTRAGGLRLIEPWFTPFALVNGAALGLTPILLPDVEAAAGGQVTGIATPDPGYQVGWMVRLICVPAETGTPRETGEEP